MHQLHYISLIKVVESRRILTFVIVCAIIGILLLIAISLVVSIAIVTSSYISILAKF